MISASNFTRFPNWLLDSMDKFHPVQWMIISLIARKTFGYDKPSREFSVRYISKKTKIPKSTVQHHLRFLIAAGHVAVVGKGKRNIQKLDIPECPGYRTETEAPYHPAIGSVQDAVRNCTTQTVRVQENKLQNNTVQEWALSKLSESSKELVERFIKGEIEYLPDHLMKYIEQVRLAG